MPAAPHFFGIRHHGPGSARSLLQALEALGPDLLLVEGPAEAEAVLPLVGHAEMRPPVALLVYAPDEPQRAVYYPLAEFSPEWQAFRFAAARGTPVRLVDLPQSHWLALAKEQEEALLAALAAQQEDEAGPAGCCPAAPAGAEAEPTGETIPEDPRRDPLAWLAAAAGYSDGERWWEHMVEQRWESADLFAAVAEAMAALRESVPPPADPFEARVETLREAHMRQAIRAAQREGFARIAVVCGAWHVPALASGPRAGEDAALLKGLPKLKTQATWVPYTHGRLCFASGYGAGIHSPGWYHHLWSVRRNGAAGTSATAVGWLTRVARLLREADLDASSAHVIEAVRLAEALAALRDRPLPGLPELNEATEAVLCAGNPVPMQLIHARLVVGEALGAVPDETPIVPLQQDLQREQRRLRLAPEAFHRTVDLDLRKSNDRERSALLHRLGLLGIPWGVPEQVYGKSGTFHEVWRLQWQPEFAVTVIEAAVWGNTVLDAASARAQALAAEATDLGALCGLVDQVLLANLPAAVPAVMARLEAQAAVASDVRQLMAALPPLVRVRRYGNVRQADTALVEPILAGLVARACIGLPGGCASLDDDAAAAMLGAVMEVHHALAVLDDAEHRAAWHAALGRMADQEGTHGLVRGRACRLLRDAEVYGTEETALRMSLALSPAVDPAAAAAWVEGFLGESGLLLLHDEALWGVLDAWVGGLAGETFTTVLPLLRRTFGRFPAPERRQMGERVRRGGAGPIPAASDDFDPVRADAALPLVARLLGLEFPG